MALRLIELVLKEEDSGEVRELLVLWAVLLAALIGLVLLLRKS
ncbi:hypothetical protein [Candidatus Accumulibacter aalborgensis]|nr:hypothetical protein [Candidatus Accumulibacter aalborgensis]